MNVKRYEVKQWLDMQIEARRLQNIPLTVKENDDGIDDQLVNYRRTDAVHIGAEAVRFLADLLNTDLCVTARKKDKDNPYEIFILYKNEKFFGLETKDEYNERGAVV